MSECPQTQIPGNRIYALSARYVLNGDYAATVEASDIQELDNPECGNICRGIYAGIDTDLDSPGTGDFAAQITECYNSNPDWVAGLINSYRRDVKDATTVVDVNSFFEFLKTKSLATQQFPGFPLNIVFDNIFRYYAGVPSNLIDIVSYDNNPIKGPVVGNNLWDELRLLAQAGCADLFVQVGGKLTIEKWKDHTSPVEKIIPCEMLISAEPAAYKHANTTLIRARGATLTLFNQGEQPLTNNELGPGTTNKCVISGLKTPVVDVSFNNLTGSLQDIRNAAVVADNFRVTANKEKIQEGSFYTKVRRKNIGDFFGPNPVGSNFMVYGRIRFKEDEGIAGQDDNTTNQDYKSFHNNLQMAQNYGFPVPHSSFGYGAFGSGTFINQSNDLNSRDNFSNSSNVQQSETVLVNPRIDTCGLSTEEITNKYVYLRPLLFKLAARRFQEIQLAQNTWNVEVAYMPCLKLNQVVQFQVPPTEEAPDKIVTGIIGGIDVVHSTDASGVQETTMSLAIMDTSCLGQTTYQSGNLITSGFAGQGSNDLNGWTTSALSIDTQASVSDYVFLNSRAGWPSKAEYLQLLIEPGEQYTWSFEYQTVYGNPLVNFNIVGAGHSQSVSGSGIATGTFTGASTSVVFEWHLLSPAQNSGFRIINFDLRLQKNL